MSSKRPRLASSRERTVPLWDGRSRGGCSTGDKQITDPFLLFIGPCPLTLLPCCPVVGIHQRVILGHFLCVNPLVALAERRQSPNSPFQFGQHDLHLFFNQSQIKVTTDGLTGDPTRLAHMDKSSRMCGMVECEALRDSMRPTRQVIQGCSFNSRLEAQGLTD